MQKDVSDVQNKVEKDAPICMDRDTAASCPTCQQLRDCISTIDRAIDEIAGGSIVDVYESPMEFLKRAVKVHGTAQMERYRDVVVERVRRALRHVSMQRD